MVQPKAVWKELRVDSIFNSSGNSIISWSTSIRLKILTNLSYSPKTVLWNLLWHAFGHCCPTEMSFSLMSLWVRELWLSWWHYFPAVWCKHFPSCALAEQPVSSPLLPLVSASVRMCTPGRPGLLASKPSLHLQATLWVVWFWKCQDLTFPDLTCFLGISDLFLIGSWRDTF